MTDLKDVTQCKSGHGEFGVEAGTRDRWLAGGQGAVDWRLGSISAVTILGLASPFPPSPGILCFPWSCLHLYGGAPESQTWEMDSLPTSAEASWRMPVSLLQSPLPPTLQVLP